MASQHPATRELAEREAHGMHVTLFWREGTRKVWIRVHELAHDVTLNIPVDPRNALDAFYHPYAYASRPTTGYEAAAAVSST